MIEINGIKYEERPQKKSIIKELPLKTILRIANFGFFTPYYNVPRPQLSNTKNKLYNIDLVKEFILIQNKESKLSRSQRENIIYLFNKKYQQINN
jgi:hypothetical protein